MKRQIATFACALAVLVSTCAPVRAEFAGSLKKNQPWVLTVSVASTSTSASVSVIYVYSNGAQEVVDHFSLRQPDGSLRVSYPKFPRSTRHIIIKVNPNQHGSAKVKVEQGAATNFETLGDGDYFEVAWDIEDE